MATATATEPTAKSPFDFPTVEELTNKFTSLNERLIESSKSAGLVAVDTYEKSVASLIALEEKFASSTELEWLAATTKTHTNLVKDVTAAYTQVAREVLK